jgi:chromosome segregation ATPase
MLFFVCLMVAPASANRQEDAGKTITQVVKLLQEMLDKSKSDGTEDRTIYAKFKCYCDTTDEKKVDAIAAAAMQIEQYTAELDTLRAENARMSQEVATLTKSISDNIAAARENSQIRKDENTEFLKEEADLVAGISQLDRAIDLLSAVGADQTVTGDVDSELAAPQFLKVKSKVGKVSLKKLDEPTKAALRAASVFLTGKERAKLSTFLQAPFTGNYGAQSGEIVGVLKQMNDTFTDNLATARAAEAKALATFTAMDEEDEKEYNQMDSTSTTRKEAIGDNAGTIARVQSELDTMKGEMTNDQDFLAALRTRCTSKKKEFEHRNMLRANEEAAIAEAISILNSDAAFATFGSVAATSTGATSFIQTASVHASKQVAAVQKEVVSGLLSVAQKTRSSRLARVVAAFTAENPLEKVLKMIDNTISILEEEEADDLKKKGTCENETADNEAAKLDKETALGNLDGTIAQLLVSINDTETSIAETEDSLAVNRASQAADTTTRNEQNAQFTKNLKNLEDAERILAASIKVLKKYYEFLHAHQADKTYKKFASKDAGGGNLKQMVGASIPDLEEACSADPECVAFNSAGWLKKSLVPEANWYDWDGGDLFIKELDGSISEAYVPNEFLQRDEPLEGEPTDAFSTGQSTEGNRALDMLNFIATETTGEKDNAIANEENAVKTFGESMASLKTSEEGYVEDLEKFNLDLATFKKELEEAREDSTATTAEKESIENYLASIKPGCNFITQEYSTRKAAREAETAALNTAIDKLKATPFFAAALAAAKKEELGKCAEICEPEGGPSRMDHAECQACQAGTTVIGFCAGNPDVEGCAEATAKATGSSDALA